MMADERKLVCHGPGDWQYGEFTIKRTPSKAWTVRIGDKVLDTRSTLERGLVTIQNYLVFDIEEEKQ